MQIKPLDWDREIKYKQTSEGWELVVKKINELIEMANTPPTVVEQVEEVIEAYPPPPPEPPPSAKTIKIHFDRDKK